MERRSLAWCLDFLGAPRADFGAGPGGRDAAIQLELSRRTPLNKRDGDESASNMLTHDALEALQPGAIDLHRHRTGYATLVRSGTYAEAAVGGRVMITPATLVVHPGYHLHSDQVFERGAVWNIDLGGHVLPAWTALKGAGVERLAASGLKPDATEVLGLLASAEPVEAQPLPAWLADFASLNVTQFSDAQDTVSREHAHRTFKRYFGMSPGRYRRERQLQAALTLIRNQAGLADTAAAAGFADQAHMTRVVKQELSVTPGRLRQEITPVQ